MRQRNNRLKYLALIPIGAFAILSGLHPDTLYHRLSLMLLTTASMEAATNGGAIGESLPTP